MPYSRKLVVEALDHFVFFALYYGIFVTAAYVVTSDIFSLVYTALMIVPVIINFVFRRITTHLGALILLHISIPVAMAIFLPTQVVTILWVGMALWLAIHSIQFAFKKPPTESASFVGVSAALLSGFSIWAAVTGALGAFAAVYPILLCIAVVGRILLIRMIKMNTSLDAMHLSYKQPIDRIVAFDYKLIVGIAVVVIGVSAFIYFVAIAPIAGHVSNYLPNAPDWESSGSGGLPAASGLRDVTPPGQTDMRGAPTFRFWNALATVVFSFTAVGIAAGAIYVAYRVLMYIYTRRTNRTNTDSLSAEIEDLREFILPGRKRRSGKKNRKEILELHPTRILFRDTAKKHVKMGVSIQKSDTPTDMAVRIRAEDITPLAEEYAGVRYKD